MFMDRGSSDGSSQPPIDSSAQSSPDEENCENDSDRHS